MRSAPLVEHSARSIWRCRGDREALRSCWAGAATLSPHRLWRSTSPEALIVGACDELRADLRGAATKGQLARCAGLRDRPPEHRTTSGCDPPPPSGSTTPRRDRCAHHPAHQPHRRDRVVADRPTRDRPGHCRAVLVSWSSAGRSRLRGGPRGPRRVSPIPPHRGRSPATGSNRSRGPPARTAPSHDRAARLRDDQRPAPTSPEASPKATRPARSGGACSASSPGSCPTS
jgi:hypothetical protein